MKLSKQDAEKHLRVMELVHSDRSLNRDQRFQIIEDFHEGAQHLNGLAGAFFTPIDLAISIHEEQITGSRSLLDLCSGIGRLSWWAHEEGIPVTCVELNPDYVAAGKRALPNANWMIANMFDDAVQELDVHMVVSNPPFGHLKRKSAPKWIKSSELQFAAVEVASRIALEGCFILPKLERIDPRSTLQNGGWINPVGLPQLKPTSIDGNTVIDEWRNASPKVDVVCF